MTGLRIELGGKAPKIKLGGKALKIKLGAKAPTIELYGKMKAQPLKKGRNGKSVLDANKRLFKARNKRR